ncbi:MAG TPA: acyl-CoA thioesterase [Candidatus Fraserbacteria bacterium]|nr:acyl-CoA thioesterase [Candidatus Fraserbacteria bacterium]
MAYKMSWKISFGEIDYASIVYYPNFFDYFQRTEEAFMEHIGFPYPYLIGEMGIAFPIVHVESDFKRAVRYGDAIDINLQVARLGTHSVTFGFRVFRGRDLCAEAQITHVTVDKASFKTVELPPDLRAHLERG